MLRKIKWWFVIVAALCLLFTGIIPAQTADVTNRLNDALSRASNYEYGASREALTDINGIVQTVLNTPSIQKPVEKQFLVFLQSDATLAGKQFVCRKLSLVGSKASIPVLSKMLEQKETFDMALFAMARIPGPNVDKVLRQMIPRTKGDQQIGIVSTLGERKDPKSIKALGKLIYGDHEIADAALSALGNIGGQEAIAVLSEAITTVSGQRRDAAMNAYMRCADRLVQDGHVSQAKTIYQKFLVPDAIRASALTGLIQAEPDKADEIILTSLQGGDSRIKSVAIRHLSRLPKVDFLDKIAAELPKLESIHQIQLLAALAERGDRSILPAVVDAAQSENGEVRLAAIEALGVLGDGSTVDLLVQVAAVQGEEREAARASLYRMRGEDVDQKILAMLEEAEPGVRAELLKSVGERSITPAAETVLGYTGDPESKVREEAIKTMGLIASPEQVPDLIKVLTKVESERERQAAENSVVAAAHRIEDKENQAKDVLAALPTVKGVKVKSSMLHVLGRIGDVHALPEIREGLKSRNLDVRKASVRALSGWPTGEPLPDLFKVAETSNQKSLKILAVRGAIQLIGLDKNLSGDNKVSMYKKALDLSTELNEKRLILAGLRSTRSLKALNMAGKYLDDPALKREAQVAVIQIGERIFENHPKEVLAFLVKVRKETEDDGIREWVEEILAEIESQQ